jgi:hypothetical protein
MSDRADQLHTAADKQVAGLIEVLSNADEEALCRPCPGREKLGDGTVGANAAHTALNYRRIGTFVAAGQVMSSRHDHGQQPRHRSRGFLRALGHAPPAHGPAGVDRHEQGFAAKNADRRELVARLAAAREDLARIAELTEQQLDSVPAKDSFRFCDGERTLEQVLLGLLKHQEHQVQALQAALT